MNKSNKNFGEYLYNEMKPHFIQELEELKKSDYELYTKTGQSHLSEIQWNWLINVLKEQK